MSSPQSSGPTSPSSSPATSPSPSSGEAAKPTESALVKQGGQQVGSASKTTIADTVVAKIAGIATRDVAGVHALGGSTTRAVGALRERIPGARTNHSQGVSVEVGERQAAVDLDIIIDYGVAIAELAGGIRRNVIEAVELMTGLEVTEVNITVHDINVADPESDDDTGDSGSRVQ